MILLVIVSYALLAVYEFIPLFKQKLWRDFWTNTVLWTLSFSVAVLLSLGVEIPSPAPHIKRAVEQLNQL
jgi:hypothetical protein